MLVLGDKLEIQDLLDEIEENKIKYKVYIRKSTYNGEVDFLEIRLVS